MPKTTIILGASKKPQRYAFLAAEMLSSYGHPIIEVSRDQPEMPTKGIDTVTMYLSEKNQAGYHQAILNLKPKRVIFNPGAENPSLAKQLNEQGIETLNACTLVMLRSNQY